MRLLQIFHAFLLAIVLFQPLSQAAESIETRPGPLSDDNFFNLVACSARPGKPCTAPIATWPRTEARDLTVRLVCKGVSSTVCRSSTAALKSAIKEINGAGADLRLRQTSSRAAIMIYSTTLEDGETISGINASIDGTVIEAARVVINYNDASNEITDGTIVLGASIEPEEMLPITLEELTQALGPSQDIRNSYYDSRSVFSEDSNTQRELGRQDKMVLRRLYPK